MRKLIISYSLQSLKGTQQLKDGKVCISIYLSKTECDVGFVGRLSDILRTVSRCILARRHVKTA